LTVCDLNCYIEGEIGQIPVEFQ